MIQGDLLCWKDGGEHGEGEKELCLPKQRVNMYRGLVQLSTPTRGGERCAETETQIKKRKKADLTDIPIRRAKCFSLSPTVCYTIVLSFKALPSSNQYPNSL